MWQSSRSLSALGELFVVSDDSGSFDRNVCIFCLLVIESSCPPPCCPPQFSFELVSFVLQMSHCSVLCFVHWAESWMKPSIPQNILFHVTWILELVWVKASFRMTIKSGRTPLQNVTDWVNPMLAVPGSGKEKDCSSVVPMTRFQN